MTRNLDQTDLPDHHSNDADNAQFSEANGFFNRRQFLSITAAVTACAPATSLANQQTKTQPKQSSNESQNLLPNSMAPAIQFQASPYGSAAYLERLSHNKKITFLIKKRSKLNHGKDLYQSQMKRLHSYQFTDWLL